MKNHYTDYQHRVWVVKKKTHAHRRKRNEAGIADCGRSFSGLISIWTRITRFFPPPHFQRTNKKRRFFFHDIQRISQFCVKVLSPKGTINYDGRKTSSQGFYFRLALEHRIDRMSLRRKENLREKTEI